MRHNAHQYLKPQNAARSPSSPATHLFFTTPYMGPYRAMHGAAGLTQHGDDALHTPLHPVTSRSRGQ